MTGDDWRNMSPEDLYEFVTRAQRQQRANERVFDLGVWIPAVEASRTFSTDPVRYVVRIVDFGGYLRSTVDGLLVAEFHPDDRDGQGNVVGTPDPQEALTWASVAAARRFVETQSTVRPLRHDGKPNRPLTSFTVRFEWAVFTESGCVLGRVDA